MIHKVIKTALDRCLDEKYDRVRRIYEFCRVAGDVVWCNSKFGQAAFSHEMGMTACAMELLEFRSESLLVFNPWRTVILLTFNG